MLKILNKGIRKSTPKEEILETGKECRRCNKCCKMGSGFFLDEQLPEVAEYLGIEVEKLKEDYLEEAERFNKKRYRPKSDNGCIFLNEDGCSIHKVKPFECRISSCSDKSQAVSIWFALNYFVDEDDAESIRQYAIYLKTQPTIPGGRIEEIVKDKEKLRKYLSYEIL